MARQFRPGTFADASTTVRLSFTWNRIFRFLGNLYEKLFRPIPWCCLDAAGLRATRCMKHADGTTPISGLGSIHENSVLIA